MKEFAYIPEEGSRPAHLAAVPFLNSFNNEQLDDVLNSSSLLQCDPGDVIIKEGTIDSRIYILLSGTLDVRVGTKVVAHITRPGEVFGELALVNQDKRIASVIAAEKAACLAVDQKFLQDLRPREEDPDFHAALFEFVARLVARKLDATSRRLAELEKEVLALRKQNGAKGKPKDKAKAKNSVQAKGKPPTSRARRQAKAVPAKKARSKPAAKRPARRGR